VLQNLGGLCKLTNFGFSCVASILDTLDLNASTTLAVVKNFTLEEMKDKILPNIDQQQQREILNSLIEAKCITKEKMLFLLKNNLDIDQFNNLNLENKNYEDVKSVLIDYMLE
jgi:transcriptional regulator CtsR